MRFGFESGLRRCGEVDQDAVDQVRLKPCRNISGLTPLKETTLSHYPNVRIHPTAILEDGVSIGPGSSVWDSVHIRHGATIGNDCIIGEKTYIAYDVKIGHRVKINAMVYICAAVTIEDGVMISAGTTFTNDRYPRATTPDLKHLRSSDPDEHTLPTLVRAGATIGAQCTIGNGLSIGRFAMIGMASLITKNVQDFHLALGAPARTIGYVCRCGEPIGKVADLEPVVSKLTCKCNLTYALNDGIVTELDPPS